MMASDEAMKIAKELETSLWVAPVSENRADNHTKRVAAAIDAAVQAERERIYTIAKDIDERYAMRIDATHRILPSLDILVGKRDTVHEILAAIRKAGA